jgi:hypothetical protein
LVAARGVVRNVRVGRPLVERVVASSASEGARRAIKAQLGLAAAPYLLTTSGKRPHTARSLGLDAQAITLRL